MLAVWKNARWNPRETGTGEKSLARRVQREREREREDFRQETGSDSVNRGIPGRGLLFEFKAKLHFSGYFKKFRI